jgi:hypothetical protein
MIQSLIWIHHITWLELTLIRFLTIGLEIIFSDWKIFFEFSFMNLNYFTFEIFKKIEIFFMFFINIVLYKTFVKLDLIFNSDNKNR